jgi:ring-1,2-phenylacetyl-CoA epoxidase subunit PaaB
LKLPPEDDAKPFEVFIQLVRGKQHVHAGTVDAVDAEMALEFAREHFGQDQACVHIWVVPRSALLGTDYERDVIWRSTDRSYKLARGYQVHNRWRQFRSKEDVKEYEQEDLKDGF